MTTGEQYATPTNLEARIRLAREFTVSPVDYHRWLFEQAVIKPGQDVLEVGVGTGLIWSKNTDRIDSSWRLVLLDRAEGMVGASRTALADLPALYIAADAACLPISDEAFDVVLAHHVMYHVDPVEDGIAEISRVLKPGGRLLAATSGRNHMRFLTDLAARVAPRWRDIDPTGPFSLDNAADLLASRFKDISVGRHPSRIVATDATAVFDYIVSLLNESECQEGAPTLAEIKRELVEQVAAKGKIEIATDGGLVAATKR